MGKDEDGTLARLKACRGEVIDPALAAHGGRLVKLMGDGALAEFASVVDAVRCAASIQRAMALRNQQEPDARRILLRIGINLGDVIVEGDDLYGDGVNIAARLEALSEPGGICMSGTAFDHARHKVDVGFASLGELGLKNIADPVRVYRVLLEPSSTGTVTAAPRRLSVRTLIYGAAGAVLIAALALFWAWRSPAPAERPSVAVLPFANLSGDAGEDYYADGITEDLITDLAKLSGLAVIARNSVFPYKGRPIVLADVARELGVRYVVEGSVRRNGERIRVNAQLSDTATGASLWADRFDRGAADVFAVQDEVIRHVAKALGVQLTSSEQERVARPPTANLEAYDNFLRGEQAAKSGLRVQMREALAFYAKATELDPSFAEAFAADARTCVHIWRSIYDERLQGPLARKRAYEKAGRALELDPELSLPYAILGLLQVVDRRYEEALASARRAVTLGPGNAEAQVALGYVLLFAGNRSEATAAIESALQIDPNLSAIDRQVAGLVFLLNGDDDRAIEILERGRKDAPSVGDLQIMLAAAYARSGRLEEARAAIAEGQRLVPSNDSLASYRVSHAHFRDPKDLDLLIGALRRAGLSDWPMGFMGDERDQRKGDAIARLVLGHTLQGHLETGQPAIMQIGHDGKTAFRSSATRPPGAPRWRAIMATAEFLATFGALAFGCLLVAATAIAERRPRTSLEPRLIPTTPVMFAGALIALLALVHLANLLGYRTGQGL